MGVRVRRILYRSAVALRRRRWRRVVMLGVYVVVQVRRGLLRRAIVHVRRCWRRARTRSGRLLVLELHGRKNRRRLLRHLALSHVDRRARRVLLRRRWWLVLVLL